jgi:hypothetical protein
MKIQKILSAIEYRIRGKKKGVAGRCPDLICRIADVDSAPTTNILLV